MEDLETGRGAKKGKRKPKGKKATGKKPKKKKKLQGVSKKKKRLKVGPKRKKVKQKKLPAGRSQHVGTMLRQLGL